MEKNRQTGRTTRIVNHVVNELFSVGGCIATDHTVFEYEKVPLTGLQCFIERVEDLVTLQSRGINKVKSTIFRDNKNKPIVNFELV